MIHSLKRTVLKDTPVSASQSEIMKFCELLKRSWGIKSSQSQQALKIRGQKVKLDPRLILFKKKNSYWDF